MTNKNRPLWLLSAVVLILFTSVGCTQYLMVPNISTYGGDIDFVVMLVSVIVIPIGCIAMGILIYLLLRHKKTDGNKASYIRDGSPYQDENVVGKAVIKNKLGRKVALVLLSLDIFVLLLDILIIVANIGPWMTVEGSIDKQKDGWTLPVSADDSFATKDVLEIKVVLRQYDFDFYYPGADGLLNTKDDFKVTHFMHVPVDRKVVIHIASPINDVLHSLFIKSLRLKQDAIPGRVIKKWFEIDKSKIDALGEIDWDQKILFTKKEQRAFFKLERGLVVQRKLMVSAKTEEAKETIRKKLSSGREQIRALYKRFGLEKRFHEIVCAELCGPDHSVMGSWMIVDSQKQFDSWYAINSEAKARKKR